jgi:YVTN family beta-propeller protein
VTNTVVGLPIPVGSNPWGVAVAPDGSKVYVTNTIDNTVSVIGTATNTVTATIPVVETAVVCLCSIWGVAVSSSHLTAARSMSRRAAKGGTFVAVIDTTTNAVTARSRCRQSTPLAYGSKVYVTGAHGGGSVIDRTTNTEIAGFGGPFTLGIVVTPDGSKVYYMEDFGGSMRRPTHWST